MALDIQTLEAQRPKADELLKIKPLREQGGGVGRSRVAFNVTRLTTLPIY